MLPYRLKRSAVTVVSAQAGRAGTPYSAMLEIADRCNEACVHCYQVQGQKGELPTTGWERVLDELAEMGVMLLTLSGGEPTLRKDFLHLVAYARRLRFAVKIYSNALNITQAMAEELGRLAVQEVQISLYSHEAAIHDGVTRVPGSFDKVVAATGYLRQAGVKVVLKTPVMSLNASGMAAYIDFVTSLGADYAVDPKLNPREDGDFAPRQLSIDHDAHLALMREPRLKMPARQGPQLLGNRVCGACNGNVHVEANGELRPCTQWSVATGHVADGGLAHAWEHNPVGKSIRELSWQSLPGCRVCDLRGHCKRCFANAQREVGDALMPYPSACRSARWSYEVRHGVAPEVLGAPGAAVPSEPPVGPYRHMGQHSFQVEAIALGPADHARRAEQPWLRGAPSPPGMPVSGQLVQLRRQQPQVALTARPKAPSFEG